MPRERMFIDNVRAVSYNRAGAANVMVHQEESNMGLFVEMTKEAEDLLATEAARHGLPTPDYARKLLERELQRVPRPRPQAKRTPTARGRYAHLGVSSEQFAKEKQQEIDMENEKWIQT